MSVLLGIQWIPFLALDIVLLAFVFLRFLDRRGVDWTPRSPPMPGRRARLRRCCAGSSRPTCWAIS